MLCYTSFDCAQHAYIIHGNIQYNDTIKAEHNNNAHHYDLDNVYDNDNGMLMIIIDNNIDDGGDS